MRSGGRVNAFLARTLGSTNRRLDNYQSTINNTAHMGAAVAAGKATWKRWEEEGAPTWVGRHLMEGEHAEKRAAADATDAFAKAVDLESKDERL